MTGPNIKSVDISSQTNDKIQMGIDSGFWKTISEALRDLIKRGFKQGIESGDFDFLPKNQLNEDETPRQASS